MLFQETHTENCKDRKNKKPKHEYLNFYTPKHFSQSSQRIFLCLQKDNEMFDSIKATKGRKITAKMLNEIIKLVSPTVSFSWIKQTCSGQASINQQKRSLNNVKIIANKEFSQKQW